MSDKEYKKYDSDIEITFHNARIAKDVRVKDGNNGKMVTFDVVATSRNDRDVESWYEVLVQDFQAELASFLAKGDTLSVVGFPVTQKDEESGREYKKIRRAELKVPIDLFMQLKERGFTPGQSSAGKAPPAKKGGAKPVPSKKAQPVKKTGAKRPVVNLDDDGDEGGEE